MKDRIIKFLTHENLTATKFADEIGVQRSSISHILSGRNNPSYEFIQKILSRYKNINAEWLLTGLGSMLKKAEQQDLFAQTVSVSQPKIPESKPLHETNTSSQHGTFAGELIKADIKVEQEIFPSRKVEKILIFYSDKTFDEFFPTK